MRNSPIVQGTTASAAVGDSANAGKGLGGPRGVFAIEALEWLVYRLRRAPLQQGDVGLRLPILELGDDAHRVKAGIGLLRPGGRFAQRVLRFPHRLSLLLGRGEVFTAGDRFALRDLP